MRIKLENIGMLENADVKVEGLTVIAGENDTGKSTLGKALFAIVKSDNISRKSKNKKPKEILATRLNLVFDGNVSQEGAIEILDDNQQEVTFAKISRKNFVSEFRYGNNDKNRKFFDATFIQSPIVFDLIDFFDSVSRLKIRQKYDYELEFDIKYPYILWDLYDKISNTNPFPKSRSLQILSDKIQETIGGEFKKDGAKFNFNKYFTGRALKIEVTNTAFGIKSFGILQLLNNNGYLNEKYVLILDEPEVHLHPAWQLKYADIVVGLVEQGIFVVVNSHSPYMVQALKYYSDKIDKVKQITNFYLAEKTDKKTHSVIKDVTNDLNQIFKALAQPLQNIVWA